ncbi:MAG TPA: toprim domain-containing protein [Thermoplasmata archaeon]|nr:toprim domain-containing protein [Thermoplasmata archaeon]
MAGGRDPTTVFEEFWDVWGRLLGESRHPGAVVVVEGERDRRSVRRLGLSGPVVLVHRGRTLSETAQHLATTSRRVIILTDWDTEGGHLAQRLKEYLGAGPSGPDLEHRRKLARVLRGELVHVEGLYGWASRTAGKAHRSLTQLLEAAEAEIDALTG